MTDAFIKIDHAELDRLDALAQEATQSPWYACTWDPMERPHVSITLDNYHGDSDIAQNLTRANAEYVGALSPERVRLLIFLARRGLAFESPSNKG